MTGHLNTEGMRGQSRSSTLLNGIFANELSATPGFRGNTSLIARVSGNPAPQNLARMLEGSS